MVNLQEWHLWEWRVKDVCDFQGVHANLMFLSLCWCQNCMAQKICDLENCKLGDDWVETRPNRSSSDISFRDSGQLYFPGRSLLAFENIFKNVVSSPWYFCLYWPIIVVLFQLWNFSLLELVFSKALDRDFPYKQDTAARFCCSLITARGRLFSQQPAG